MKIVIFDDDGNRQEIDDKDLTKEQWESVIAEIGNRAKLSFDDIFDSTRQLMKLSGGIQTTRMITGDDDEIIVTVEYPSNSDHSKVFANAAIQLLREAESNKGADIAETLVYDEMDEGEIDELPEVQELREKVDSVLGDIGEIFNLGDTPLD